LSRRVRVGNEFEQIIKHGARGVVLLGNVRPIGTRAIVKISRFSLSGRDPLIGLNFMIWKSQEFLQAPNMID
jgi:hypothetical protein